MALDHGMLNLPLSKRGDIDVQIDAYKAELAATTAKARKLAYQVEVANRVKAKALVASTTWERWAELSARAGQPVAAVKDHVTSQAHWRPAFVINLLKAA